jgi:nicotinamide-nucleotide amidase
MSITVARRVARLLQAANCKIVFAESCTGGLVSGALTKIPGISQFHCGGVVVYRNETKQAYLGIPADVLKEPGAVSPQVAELMAKGVLQRTPEADLAAAVTGHLGPNAPPHQDGLVFMALVGRGKIGRALGTTIRRIECRRSHSRSVRQEWVVEQVLRFVAERLAGEDEDED